jgi:branched-chain amino acid transport system permease protein
MSDAQALVENILNALAAGIVIGGMYGLMCVGLGLIFGIMKVINFAQGELLMLGMYVTVFLFGSLGLGTPFGPYVGPLSPPCSRGRCCSPAARCCTAV